MTLRALPALALAALLAQPGPSGPVSPAPAHQSPSCTVERVIDGDTFVCRDGERVRLLLVNTPEMHNAPLGRLAREFVLGVLPPGTEARLEFDVERRDRYGRLLAFVYLPDGRMLNRLVARRGFAQVMVIPPNVHRVETMRAAVDSARAEGAGLWGLGLGGGEEGAGASGGGEGGEAVGACDPSYPEVCIPGPPPDLDCSDISQRGFRVVGRDPHGFDGDGDGVGCESRREKPAR